MSHLISINRLSASASSRAVECPGSLTLPWAEDEPHEYAKLGTEVHEWLCLVLGAEPYNKPMDLKGGFLSPSDIRRDFDDLTAPTNFEWALAWDSVYGKSIKVGENIHRAYPDLDPSRFIMGSVDYHKFEGGTLLVGDFKTGKSVGAPHKNAQLKTLAVLLRNYYTGVERVELELSYIKVRDPGPRTPIGSVRRKREEIDLWDLDEWENVMADTLVQAKESLANPTRMEYFNKNRGCTFCPAQGICPIFKEL